MYGYGLGCGRCGNGSIKGGKRLNDGKRYLCNGLHANWRCLLKPGRPGKWGGRHNYLCGLNERKYGGTRFSQLHYRLGYRANYDRNNSKYIK